MAGPNSAERAEHQFNGNGAVAVAPAPTSDRQAGRGKRAPSRAELAERQFEGAPEAREAPESASEEPVMAQAEQADQQFNGNGTVAEAPAPAAGRRSKGSGRAGSSALPAPEETPSPGAGTPYSASAALAERQFANVAPEEPAADAKEPSVQDRNKDAFRRFAEEAWNKGNLAVVDEVFAPEYVAHAGNEATQDVHGPEGHKAFIAGFRAAFPDVHLTFDDLLADDQTIVVRMRWEGTHTGDYMGIPPTGKRISVAVTGVNRFSGDKVVEAWGVVDTIGMLQQLGVMPSPPRAEANKSLLRVYVEQIWNNSRLDLVTEVFAPNYLVHTPGMLMPVNHEELKDDIARARTTFPDIKMTIQHMVTDGDKVAVHWTTKGTHKGEFTLPGMPRGIPPSGNQVEFTEVGVYRVENGKIAEAWVQADVLSMLQQVGAIPPQGSK